MRKYLTLWPILLVLVQLTGCTGETSGDAGMLYPQQRFEGQAIGTTYNIIYLEDGQSQPPAKLKKEFSVLVKAANQSMSIYQRDSEISTFNRMKSTEPMKISKTFHDVVAEGIRLHDMTSGSLDITLKPLSAIWGFGPDKKPHTIPSDKAIAEVKAKTGVDKLILTDTTIAKTVPDLEMDLNTIGKGFLVDQAAKLLESHHINNYLVEIGGEMRTKGHNGHGKPWRIGVVNPDGGTPRAQTTVFPGDSGVATSGDYYQYFEENGIRYSHILDPATGKPIAHKLASVTVFQPTSMTADGLATAIMVMGADKGLAMAEKYHIPIYLILRENDKFVTRMSTSFKPFLQEDEVAKRQQHKD